MIWEKTGGATSVYGQPKYYIYHPVHPKHPDPPSPDDTGYRDGCWSELDLSLHHGAFYQWDFWRPPGGRIGIDCSTNLMAHISGPDYLLGPVWLLRDGASASPKLDEQVRQLPSLQQLEYLSTFPGAIHDKNHALFIETSDAANTAKLWLKDGATVETIANITGPLHFTENDITPAPINRDDDTERLWIAAGSKILLEKRAGGSGPSRWHQPPSMSEGAIRLNERGEAITRGDSSVTPAVAPKLWRNGIYTDLNEVASKPETVTITQAIDLASNGIILAQATDSGVTKTGLLLPVEVVGSDKKTAFEPKFGRMENSLNADGELDIDEDEDHFFVRITGGTLLDNASIKLATVENPVTAYNDDETKIEMITDGGDLITKSLLLVSDDVDDDYAGNEVGADDADNDRTHKVQLGGKLMVKSVTFDEQEHPLDLKTLVPAKKKLSGRIVLIGDTAGSAQQVAQLRDIAMERYAQVGIKFDFSITTIPVPTIMPPNFDPTSVRDDGGVYGQGGQGGTLIHEDVRALYDAAKTAGKTDVITVLVVPDMQDNVAGRAFLPSNTAPPHAQYVNTVILSLGRLIEADRKFTLAHEVGHVLTNDGHYGAEYEASAPLHKINHNLMREGTSQGNTLIGSKRWFKVQDAKFQQNLLRNP